MYEEEKAAIAKNGNSGVIEAKIKALNEAVQEYIKAKQEDIINTNVENRVVKQFQYGKNDEKTGYYVQTFVFKANDTINGDNDNKDNAEENITEEKNNQVVGGVTYNMELIIDKLHTIGHIDVDSENSDVSAVAVYRNNMKNDASLNFSGNFRQTIEKNNNKTNIGTSFDYINNKFSAGGYGTFQKDETEGITYKTLAAEGYGRYGKSLRVSAGYFKESAPASNETTKYVSAKVSGRRELKDKNLTLMGSLSGTYGIVDKTAEVTNESNILDINANGGLSFKSSHSDLSANVLANVNTDRGKPFNNNYETTVTSTLLGNVSNDKIDVTATSTAINSSVFVVNNSQDIVKDRATSWSSSITIGLKKIFGKNVTPSFTYNLNSDDELKHTFAANVGINF